ncbi:MAG: fumarylacetoacetate hydrolase family protein [Roseiarcus sp.]|jgi:2-keto-4-pentenoate hydratase
MKNGDVINAAKTLMDEHACGEKFRPFASAFQIGDIDAAYAVQREYVRLQMQSRGAGPVGHKVGLTSPRMQEMCGIDSPIAGVVLEDRLHRSGVSLQSSRYGRLGLEFEIAVRLARDLGREGSPVTLSDVADAVDAVCPAVEIVDDRDCDYKTLDVFSLVADNSWNAGIVLGAFQRVWPDLAAIEGVVSANGDIIDRGFGRDVLGHPFHSVAWLAKHLADAGEGLRAGDIVMTGNLVTTRFPSESSHYRFDLGGLGAVQLSIRM